MKSSLYSKTFIKLLKEDSFAGDAGAFGDAGQAIYDPQTNINSNDGYAPGDARNVIGLKNKKGKPPVDSRNGRVNKDKKKKNKKKGEGFIHHEL